MSSKSYRDLIVWQKALDLVDDIYLLSSGFPDKEKFGLTSQIRGTAISIPSNIAEGQGRYSTKEFQRFLHISLGSLAELDTQIEIAFRQKMIDELQKDRVRDQIVEIRKMLFGLINSLKSNS